MDNNISIITAFFAGLLSFVSPCVLPLLSTYLVFISGSGAPVVTEVSDSEKKISERRINLIISTLFFVLGFSVVFIVLSIALYSFIFFLGGVNKILNSIAGGIVIVLGLNILFNFIPFLKYDDSGERCETCTPKHSILGSGNKSIVHPERRPKGFLGSFIVGLAFGAGWTPCVGAFLGSILLMASQSETMALAIVFLIVYSAGLGLPFIIASFFWDTVIQYIYKIRPAMTAIRIISGIFLVVIGALMAAGRFFLLNSFFQKNGYLLSRWAQGGTPGVYLLPAIIFLLIALLPIVIRLIRKKKIISTGIIIWASIFAVLAVSNGTGVINCLDYIARWLSFAGI
jgi:cytochrome c-type biogenesis protein